MQECSIEVGTPAATHEVIGKLFSFSVLDLMQGQGDQTVVTKAIGGAMVLEGTVGLAPLLDIALLWRLPHHRDACITSVFNACTPR